jgi:tRNA threonylcarbamoyl adenosine modification protein (Sua5/YciO/YrdC/YwlC family)
MEIIHLHPENPEARHIKRIADLFRRGGLVVYPTDSGYSVGCDVSNAKALEKLYNLKKPLKKYVMALLLPDLKTITEFAVMDNTAYRMIKERVPGHFTFILPAQTHIVRRLKVKRWEVGVRIPQHPFLNALLSELNSPIVNTAARIRDDEDYTDPQELERAFQGRVDAIIHCGEVQLNPTNIISFVNGEPELLRGDWDAQ